VGLWTAAAGGRPAPLPSRGTTSQPRPAPAPPAATAAAVLGIVAALPLLLTLLGLVLMTGDEHPVAPTTWLWLLVAVPQPAGAVLLLRRRGWRVLALGCLPGLLLFAPPVAQAGSHGALAAPLPLAGLVLQAVTLGLTLQRDVRRWTGARTRA
jgi:hypothetical protein